MKKLLVALTATILVLGLIVPAIAGKNASANERTLTWHPNYDPNGKDYQFSELPYPAWVTIWVHAAPGDAPFTIRVLRIGQQGAVFHETSAYEAQCGCQAVTSSFGPPTPQVGGYVIYVDNNWTHRSTKVVAAFVVT